MKIAYSLSFCALCSFLEPAFAGAAAPAEPGSPAGAAPASAPVTAPPALAAPAAALSLSEPAAPLPTVRPRRWFWTGGVLLGIGVATSLAGVGVLAKIPGENTSFGRGALGILGGGLLGVGLLGLVLPGAIVLGHGRTLQARLARAPLAQEPPSMAPLTTEPLASPWSAPSSQRTARQLAIAGGTLAAIGLVSTGLGVMCLTAFPNGPDTRPRTAGLGLTILGPAGLLVPGVIIMSIGLGELRTSRRRAALQLLPTLGPSGGSVSLVGHL